MHSAICIALMMRSINICGLEGYSIRGPILDPDDFADATGQLQDSLNEEDSEITLDADSTDSTPSTYIFLMRWVRVY